MDDVRVRLRDAGLARLLAGAEKGVQPALRLALVAGAEACAGPGAAGAGDEREPSCENACACAGGATRSRLGGLPDLPPGVAWPEGENNPMQFVAQIDLAEARAFELEPAFPREGLLSFFYSSVEPDGPYFPDAREEIFLVRFSAAGEALVRCDAPADLPEAVRAPAHAVRFVSEETWPTAESATLDALGPSDAERAAWARALDGEEDAGELRAPVHRLLGHPRLLRPFDPRLECVLAEHDAYFHDFDERHPRYPALLRERAAGEALRADVSARDAEWLLLLHSESDARLGTCRGGTNGALEFWIRRADLAALRFDRVWCVKQSGADASQEMRLYSY